MSTRSFIGLDLGQGADPTALAVVQRPAPYVAGTSRPAYALLHLKRFPPGTPYAVVVASLVELLHAPGVPGAVVGADQTGVGRAVLNLVRDGLEDRVTCQFVPVTLTTGVEATTGELGGWYLPKKELVGTLLVLLQTRRLQLPRELPEAQVLVQELQHFRMRPALVGQSAELAWRERERDDLVLALGLAAWLGETALAGEERHEEPTTTVLWVP